MLSFSTAHSTTTNTTTIMIASSLITYVLCLLVVPQVAELQAKVEEAERLRGEVDKSLATMTEEKVCTSKHSITTRNKD